MQLQVVVPRQRLFLVTDEHQPVFTYPWWNSLGFRNSRGGPVSPIAADGISPKQASPLSSGATAGFGDQDSGELTPSGVTWAGASAGPPPPACQSGGKYCVELPIDRFPEVVDELYRRIELSPSDDDKIWPEKLLLFADRHGDWYEVDSTEARQLAQSLARGQKKLRQTIEEVSTDDETIEYDEFLSWWIVRCARHCDKHAMRPICVLNLPAP